MAAQIPRIPVSYLRQTKLPNLSRRRFLSHSPIAMSRLIDTIKQDHREIESYYNTITNSKDEDEQIRYQNQFTWELARHSIGEELVVYPAFERHLDDGKSVADKDRREHQTVLTSFLPSI